VAATGLAVAAYLVVVHYAGGEPACFIAHGCAVVQHSRYATLLGVPVAVLGVGTYTVVLAALARDGDRARELAAAAALAGAGFSLWLTYVEVARLHAVCAWCVVSAACMVTLAALCTSRLRRGLSAAAQGGAGCSRA
jgi:uncharacterized membrane protein